MPTNEERDEIARRRRRAEILLILVLSALWCAGVGLLISAISRKDLTQLGYSSIVVWFAAIPSLVMMAPPARDFVVDLIVDLVCCCCNIGAAREPEAPPEHSGEQA